MSAYVIVDVHITDNEKFAIYRGQASDTVAQYGGRFLVRGGTVEPAEGEWTPSRFVVIEFDDMARAKQWYGSEEYAGPLKLRHEAADSNLIFVQGV